jgi:integrative and conjugative element protein (TIGR02256 family)
VSLLTVPVYPVRRTVLGNWTLVVDEWLVTRLKELRADRLPNETGGVLLGMYDLTRRVVYVVDTIPSPPDSKEWPTLYIRGSKGLSARVTEVTQKTAGQLEYVGEWHSHPDRCSCDPSMDDLTVFTWLTDHMAVAGLPALMAIVGQGDSSRWFLGEMLRAGDEVPDA